ncbi:hypothetical protein GCM10009830_28930 [Glycomyces endophyticus]|uniref:Uncharacterized protein n=1 Tax=Glycomyces endophyticus TaxID=480996 RepID=A0ABP4T047_9ACTN
MRRRMVVRPGSSGSGRAAGRGASAMVMELSVNAVSDMGLFELRVRLDRRRRDARRGTAGMAAAA